jgi:hypothetical protein
MKDFTIQCSINGKLLFLSQYIDSKVFHYEGTQMQINICRMQLHVKNILSGIKRIAIMPEMQKVFWTSNRYEAIIVNPYPPNFSSDASDLNCVRFSTNEAIGQASPFQPLASIIPVSLQSVHPLFFIQQMI